MPQKKQHKKKESSRQKGTAEASERNGQVSKVGGEFNQYGEVAKSLAFAQARFSKKDVFRIKGFSYVVLREVKQLEYGYVYECKKKGSDVYFMRTEPISTNEYVKQFENLKNELHILRKAHTHKVDEHFVRAYDSGATSECRFFATQPLGPTIHDITQNLMKSAFSPSTAFRVSLQAFAAITDLHTLDYLHQFIGPEMFAIGRRKKIKTVYFTGFPTPSLFRNQDTMKVKKARPRVRATGFLQYMPRASHLNREHSRRDDLESWIYFSLELFDLKVLPWHDDDLWSVVLEKKQRLVEDEYPEVYKKSTDKYNKMLKYCEFMGYEGRPCYDYMHKEIKDGAVAKMVNFNQPYDWELVDNIMQTLKGPSDLSAEKSQDCTPTEAFLKAKDPTLKPFRRDPIPTTLEDRPIPEDD